MKIIQKLKNSETDKIDKKVVETQAIIAMATATMTSDILNLLGFLLMLDPVILSNL